MAGSTTSYIGIGAAGIVELEIVVHAHEQYPHRFADQQVLTAKGFRFIR